LSHPACPPPPATSHATTSAHTTCTLGGADQSLLHHGHHGVIACHTSATAGSIPFTAPAPSLLLIPIANTGGGRKVLHLAIEPIAHALLFFS